MVQGFGEFVSGAFAVVPGSASADTQYDAGGLFAEGVDVDALAHRITHAVYGGRIGLGAFGLEQNRVPGVSKAVGQCAVCGGRGKLRAGGSDRALVGSNLRRRSALSLWGKSGRDRFCGAARSRIRADADEPGIE